MFADIFGAAGVVEDDGEVEGVGVLDFVEEPAVDFAARLSFRDEVVELIDAAEGVFVSGVAVEELVLDEAVECAEFGQVASEDADAVHESEGASDFAFAFEDALEDEAVGFGVAEGPVDIRPVCGDEAADLRAEFEVAELAVLEEAEEARRIVLEDVGIGGEEHSVTGDEAVEFLAAFFSESEEGAEAVFRAVILFDLESFH